MARVYTADDLVAMARDEARVPNVQATGSRDQDILNRINEYLAAILLGLVMEAKEEYFVRTTRTTLVASQSRYRLPARAMYQKLRDLRYVISGGNEYRPLGHIAVGSLDERSSGASGDSSPTSFYLEANEVVLWPPAVAATTGFLDLSFYLQPGDLVLVANTRKVSSVSLATKTVTLTAAIPSTWTTASTFDIHSPNSGAEVKVFDRTATTVSGTTITFTDVIDGTIRGDIAVAANDYVCLAGEAAIPGVPRELHPALGLAGAVSVLSEEGDLETMMALQRRLDLMLHGTPDGKNEGALGRLRQRVEVKPKFVGGAPFLLAQGR